MIELLALDDEIWNMLRRMQVRRKTAFNGLDPVYMMILQDRELVAVSFKPFTMEEVIKELAEEA